MGQMAMTFVMFYDVSDDNNHSKESRKPLNTILSQEKSHESQFIQNMSQVMKYFS